MGMAMEKRGDSGIGGCRSSTIQRGGATALSCSSCLKAEREIKDREKEIKEDEGQKGKKIGTGVSHLPVG